MRGLPNGCVVHVQVVANRAHHHLARVQADADLDVEPLPSPQLLGIPANGLLHVQGSIARPYRMVLMRQRCPKQGHDAVAQHLVHRALVAVDGGHEVFKHRVEELPGLLGVAVGQQLHRALEVRKQDRDLLALAFERAFGGENLLGEIGGRVGERRPCGCLCRCGGPPLTGPDKDAAVLIGCQALTVEELVLEVVERSIVELKLPLEGAIGQAAPLAEQGNHLIQDRNKVHPSLLLPLP